jgi:orotate phosphoribosyltransferase
LGPVIGASRAAGTIARFASHWQWRVIWGGEIVAGSPDRLEGRPTDAACLPADLPETPEEPMTAATPKDALIALVKERSFQQGAEMKLASGRTSSFYFNMKPTMLHPAGAHLIASLILERIDGLGAELVGGLEMGAVPIAAAVAAVSHARGTPIRAFFVRKQAKEHGTQSLIEGLAKGETMTGRKVVVVEDVTTTGGSAIKAAEAVAVAGGRVVAVVTIVDRQEGAGAAFAAAGLAFLPLLTVDDFRTSD